LFELLGRLIAKRRVQPATIVVTLDKLLDVHLRMIQIPIVVSIDRRFIRVLFRQLVRC
jgi:hypothetical protein